jgi:hypothetical protein
MTSQSYGDFTFVLGPPSGDRYDILRNFALENGEDFSTTYKSYSEQMISSAEHSGQLDHLFSVALNETIQINRVFPTFQFWLKRKEEFHKFYLSPDDKSAEIPAFMVFPSEFTDCSGSGLAVNVEVHHANFVGAAIGKSLKLDWVQVIGTHSSELEEIGRTKR